MTVSEQERTPLMRAVLSALAYYDGFDYPLTLLECYKWLYVHDQPLEREPTIGELRELLLSSPLDTAIDEKHGFFFFKGREDIVEERQKRNLWADRKYKRALRIIRILKYLPFVRMIAICNTLALSHSRDASDIDLFIITKTKRVWTARFWCAALLKLFRARPEERSRDGICLTFFTDTDHLDLSDIEMDRGHDIYLTYWVDQIVPVYDPRGLMKHFRNANRWIEQRIPYSYPVVSHRLRTIEESFGSWLVRNAWEWTHWRVLGNVLERIYRRIQMRVLPERLRRIANVDTRVLLTDSRLKFHENDRRQMFRQKWEERRKRIFATLGI